MQLWASKGQQMWVGGTVLRCVRDAPLNTPDKRCVQVVRVLFHFCEWLTSCGVWLGSGPSRRSLVPRAYCWIPCEADVSREPYTTLVRSPSLPTAPPSSCSSSSLFQVLTRCAAKRVKRTLTTHTGLCFEWARQSCRDSD